MRTRKLLCGAAAGAFLLAFPATAWAQEDEGTISQEEAAHEVAEIAEEAGLEHDVVECVENAVKQNSTDACIESPNPILPATNEIVWGGLAFVALLGVMWKFGVPAATNMMNERTERIRNDIDTADRARSEAEGVLAEYQRQLADARTESARIIDEARQQADQVRRDLTARAEAEAAGLRARNAEQLVAERDRVLGELRGQVAGLAVELAEKVVESSLDREANLALIESYINSVGNGSR